MTEITHTIVAGDGDTKGLRCGASGLTSWNRNDVLHVYCAAPTCRRFLHPDEVEPRTERPQCPEDCGCDEMIGPDWCALRGYRKAPRD